jgi:LPS-assembly protein
MGPGFADASGWVCQPTNTEEPWQCHSAEKPSTDSPLFPFIQWIPSQDPHLLCGGYYQEPDYATLPTTASFKNLPITLSAEKSSLLAEGPSSFIGNVTVQQGNRTIHADKAIIERDNNTGRLRTLATEGHFVLTEPGLQIEGAYALTHVETQKTQIQRAQYVLPTHHAHGKADNIALDESHHITLRNAQYSTCSPLAPDWKISAEKIRLDTKKGRGYASGAKLRIKDVPVLYFPYLNFPINRTRQSGFLYPSLGSSSQSGTTLEVPYYWNIAPNLDATLTPTYITLRGPQAQILGRYLTHHNSGQVQASFLPHDAQYSAFKNNKLLTFAQDGLQNDDPRVLALNKPSHRAALSWKHEGNWHEQIKTHIHYDWVSDDNYFMDLSNNIHTSNTSLLPQEAVLDLHGRHTHSSLKIQEYQTLHPYIGPVQQDLYRKQPDWHIQTHRPIPHTPFQWAFFGNATQFFHQRDTETHYSFTRGTRLFAHPTLSYPIYKPYATFIPQAHLYYAQYYLQRGTQDRALNRPNHLYRTLPAADVDASLHLERLWGSHTRQTVEPRLYYLYVPYLDQIDYPDFDSGILDFGYDRLFEPNRFIGFDRIGDAHQLTVSLTTRFFTPFEQSEKFRLSVGEIIYFKSPKVSLCDPALIADCLMRENSFSQEHTSNIAALAHYRFTPEWSVNTTLEWNRPDHTTEKSGVGMQYRGERNRIFNVGYQYIRQDNAETPLNQGAPTKHLKQTDVSFAWPIRAQWRGLMRWHYDLEDKTSIDTLAGVEYNTCCIAFQITASRYLRTSENWVDNRYARALFVRVLLKGLSSVQLSPNNRQMNREIPGFRSFVDTGFTTE